MNYINRFFQVTLASLIIVMSGCETTELDLTADPNALGPDQASTTLFLNSVQQDFGKWVAEIEDEASEASRIIQYNDNDYANAFGGPTNFDNAWSEAYQQMLQDIRTMQPLAEDPEVDQAIHVAMGKFFEAFIITTLVDLFGDIPYSEALQGAENFNPGVDDGSAVYAAAQTLLDEAIAGFSRNTDDDDTNDVVSLPNDLYYGGNWENWIRAANSLKMKLYVNTRNASAFDGIVAGGLFIEETSQDLQWQWGNSVTNPDTRHPRYTLHYTPSGVGGGYMSNWLMDYMMNDKVGNGNATFEGRDSRMKYYFYRQSPVISSNPNDIACIIQPAPAHFAADEVYCTLPDGYWGRDHGNDRGIPPDTQSRTAYGVYPVGGLFDDNSFNPIVSITQGGGGAGITPLILASYMDFLRAEMALVGGDATTANTLMQAGVTKSMAKVRTFGSVDPTADLSTEPATADDALYVQELGQVFAAAADNDERMDILGSEYFVTLFGNGLDGYNFYRRTGRPSTLQTHFFAVPGDYYSTFLYPSRFVERNSSTEQKTGVTDRVFWDVNGVYLAN